MSAGDKSIILAQVENQYGGKRQALMALWYRIEETYTKVRIK